METIHRTRRERPKVVTLTEAAAARVREIMGRAEKPYAGLRVGVKNGGCAGQEYVLEYAETSDPLDEIVEDKGVKILIEPKAVLSIPEVKSCAVNLVFDPPWDPSLMSDEAKLELNMF